MREEIQGRDIDSMLVNIQTLRFVAAFGVVLYHLQPHLPAPGALSRWITATGYLGVDLFFVISGLIIWHTTQSLRGGPAAIAFLWRRLTRIYAGYWPWFMLLLMLAAWWLHRGLAGKDLIGSALLLRTPIPELLLPVAWTLTFELWFYLCFTPLLLLSRRLRLGLLLLAGLLVLLLQGRALLAGDVWRAEGFAQVSSVYRFYASPYVLEFIAGALLGAGWRWLRLAPVCLLFGALLLTAIGLVIQARVAEASLIAGYHAPLRVLLFGSAALLLVAWLLLLEREGHRLGGRFGLFLGAISYSLYLSHTILLEVSQQLGWFPWFARLMPCAGGCATAIGAALLLALILLCSALVHLWLERPLLASLRRLGRGLRRVLLVLRQHANAGITPPRR